ncbi:reverse transcriptase domain-containing protein [Tanacetum coccineum]
MLVAKGYSQQPRIDYDETFNPVAYMDTVQAITSLAYHKGNNKKMIEDFKNEMMQKYEMSDFGLLNHFLEMEIYQDEGGVFACQEKYVEKILRNFDMSECKLKDTPLVVNEALMKEDGSSKVDATLYRSLMGKLLYLTDTRPDIIVETVEGGDELEQENAKKQKIDDDQEEAEMKKLMEIVPDEEEVAVDAIPLATKPPSIVDWKIIKEGKLGYYQIIRADGNSKRYSSMIQMLKSFDREDLETLWKLIKAKHGSTRP